MKTLTKLFFSIFLTLGLIIQTNAQETARVQVIHNSADAAAETVDIWLNDGLLLDDFSFRSASPFIDAPAGEEFTIGVAPPSSESADESIATFDYTLEGGEKYILVANGIVSEDGYDPAKPFNIYVYGMAREMASAEGNTDALVFHGATDAPVVDVVEVGQGAGTIVDDAGYGDFAGYLELPTENYSLQVRDGSGTSTVAQFGAPLADLELEGQSLAIMASGFLNPDNNSGGEAFGLYVALPSGGELVELPAEAISTARVQVIHNSADAAAETVDIWLNDGLLLDDFSFRSASPFIDAPAGEEFTIGVAPPSSESADESIATFDYTLEGGEKYILVANGIVSEDGYDPAKPFNIYVYGMAREMASAEGNTDALVFHGATDAPVVDVVEVGQGAGTIVDDAGYGDFAGYLELPTADYQLSITDETGETEVAVFGAPLSSLNLGGDALVILASGFLNPGNNSDGPAFGLFVALPSGGDLVALNNTTGVEENEMDFTDWNLYPNPARQTAMVSVDEMAENIMVRLVNMTGQLLDEKQLDGKRRVVFDVANYPDGIYLVSIISGNSAQTRKLQVIK